MSEPEILNSYERGKAFADHVAPGLEDSLRARYEEFLPGLAETIVDVNFGHFYARGGLEPKTRLLAAIGTLAALGTPGRPQLKVDVAAAMSLGANKREISEVIFQVAMFAGFPTMLAAMNAAIEVFESREESP